MLLSHLYLSMPQSSQETRPNIDQKKTKSSHGTQQYILLIDIDYDLLFFLILLLLLLIIVINKIETQTTDLQS